MRPHEFNYDGIIDTLHGHCNTLDLDVGKYYEYICRHNLKKEPRKRTFAEWAVAVLERRKIALAKVKYVPIDFICELCGKATLMKDESLMTGKCIRCYYKNHLLMRA